jgi:hypothetical protein
MVIHFRKALPMRALHFVTIVALLAIPSLAYSQDDRAPGPIGPDLRPLRPAQPSESLPGASPTGSPSQEQSFVGYPATPGSEAPNNLITTPVAGGLVSAIVGGHNVIIDPTTRVIVRVLN